MVSSLGATALQAQTATPAAPAAADDKSIFVPSLVYRTGTFAPSGTPTQTGLRITST
jgi:hypothetical protein